MAGCLVKENVFCSLFAKVILTLVEYTMATRNIFRYSRDIKLPEPLLAYKLLKGASLDEEARRVVRATCKELKLSEMKKSGKLERGP